MNPILQLYPRHPKNPWAKIGNFVRFLDQFLSKKLFFFFLIFDKKEKTKINMNSVNKKKKVFKQFYITKIKFQS